MELTKMNKFIVKFMIIVLNYIFHKEVDNYIGISACKLMKELEDELNKS